MLKGLAPFLKAKEIKSIIKNLSRQITKDYPEKKELTLICPLRGSVFFLSDLIRCLNRPVQLDFVLIEPFETGETSYRIKKDISLNLKGRDVLIVEGIIDSGLSLFFLKQRLRLAQPASLKTAALLNKSSRRKAIIHADYIGKNIDDRFILGYGMDLNEEGRQHPDMYHLGQ